MFNQNSPIVQQMLNGVNGNSIGNLNIGFASQMYPDPMQMYQQQQNGYFYNGPTPQVNIGINTNMVQPMLQGYNNPYFRPSIFSQSVIPNYGAAYNPTMYAGFNSQQYDPTQDRFYGFNPSDPVSRNIMEIAIDNNVTYMEQLTTQVNIIQKGLDIAFKMFPCDEQTEKTVREVRGIQHYDPQKKVKEFKNEIVNIDVIVTRGKEVVYDSSKSGIKVDEYTLLKYQMDVENDKRAYVNYVRQKEYLNYCDRYRYNNAIERQADNMDLYDFMTKVAPKIVRQMKDEDARRMKAYNTAALYNSSAYRNLVEKLTGKKPKPMNMIAGRNGVYPDGRMVSPGVDPRIAEAFVYDPKTGTTHITVPDFMKNRTDDSMFKSNIIQKKNDERKAAFMNVLHQNTLREEMIAQYGQH